MTMVEIKNLSKHFGPFKAVNNISFSVARGEVLGFLGPNGAGKSTTMKMITGFLTPDGGSVAIGGKDLADNPVAAKKLIGYLPEGAPAYPDMTPAAFLEFIAEVRGIPRHHRDQRIRDTVAKVNLESVLYQSIETLSKGFKRRVGLAQAIIHDPAVLVLDEPTDGLDPNQKHEVRSLIQNMASEKAIILSTHILEEVDAVCTRAIIIAGGEIIADGSPHELEARSPTHNSIVITLRGVSAAAANSVLSAIPGVSKITVESEDAGQTRLHLYSREQKPVITAVSDAARIQQWHVEELHVFKGRLDEVFRTVTANRQSLT